MTRFSWFIWTGILVNAFLLHGGEASGPTTTDALNRPERWAPKGTSTVERQFDGENRIIKFTTTKTPNANLQIHPAFLLNNDESWEGVRAIRFECRVDAPMKRAILLFPRQDDFNGHFSFAPPVPGEWKSVEITLNADGYDWGKARLVQVLLHGEGDTLEVHFRNFALLDETESVLKTFPRPKKLALNPHNDTPSQTLGRVRPDACFMEPGRPFSFLVPVPGLVDGTKVGYRVLDYVGNTVSDGSLKVVDNRLTFSGSLKTGFYELHFPDLNRSYGLIAAPSFQGGPDDFWGMNTLFANLIRKKPGDANYQEGFGETLDGADAYGRVLKRAGIRHIREMSTTWAQLPESGRIDYNAHGARNVDRLAEAHDLRVLAFYAHFPQWAGIRSIYEGNRKAQTQVTELKDFLPSYFDLIRHGLPVSGGTQVYNEGNLSRLHATPDPVATLTWATRHFFDTHGIDQPLVGMAFAGFAESCLDVPGYLELYRDSGFFDAIDAFSVNGYGSPEVMVSILSRLVAAMTEAGIDIPPFWITESGRAWPKGTIRANLEDDRASADWIARKAIEAKALGVERYYPFTLVYLDEDANNFGLFDGLGSPHRGFAAYAACVRFLSGLGYVGDWPDIPEGASAVRVFAAPGKTVLVLYANTDRISVSGFPPGQCHSVDGAELAPDSAGTVAAPGGIMYMEIGSGEMDVRVVRDTPHTRVKNKMKAPSRETARNYPILFRHHHEDFDRSRDTYFPPEDRFVIQVSALNLDDKPHPVSPVFRMGDRTLTLENISEAPLAPNEERLFRWPVQWDSLNTAGVSGNHRIFARVSDANGKANPLAMRYNVFHKGPARLQIAPPPGKWRQNASGKVGIAGDGEDTLRFEAVFDQGDRWVYPEYDMALPAESLAGCSSISYDIRVDSQSAEAGFRCSGVFVVLEDGRKYGLTDWYRKPGADWKNFTFQFAPEHSPEKIRTISIGGNPNSDRATIWIRNIRFH